MKPGWVYFLKPIDMAGPIKIGCSGLPKSRLDSYKAWTPWPIEIMGAVKGSYKDESFLHSCFADHHQHGEWFKADPFVVETIRKIIAADSIDVVRGDIVPVRSIKNGKPKRKRTPDECSRFSYNSRIRHLEQRMRKSHERWHSPADVCSIMNRWGGYRYWDAAQKDFVTVPKTTPSAEEISRLVEYLTDPITHSVIPTWKQPKEPICIPVFGQDAEAA